MKRWEIVEPLRRLCGALDDGKPIVGPFAADWAVTISCDDVGDVRLQMPRYGKDRVQAEAVIRKIVNKLNRH